MTIDEVIAQKFEIVKQRTIKVNECLLFQGALSSGYGVIDILGHTVKVHKLSAHVHFGINLWDGSIQINHKVECPNKNCWNPEHIYVGNQSDNAHDRQQTKNAVVGPWGNASHELAKTHCPQGHEYTPENTQYQFVKKKNSTYRKCRECSRLRKNKSGKRRLRVGKHYSSMKVK